MKKIILPILFLALSSCAPKQSKPSVARPIVLTETIQKALNSLTQPPIPLDSLSGFAEVEVEVRGRKQFMQMALLAQEPNRLRISLLDDLGQEQGRLVADGHRVLWINHREGIWEHLPQGDHSLKRVLKLPLTVEEFIQRILVKVPPGQPQEAKTLTQNSAELSRNLDRYEIQMSPPRLKNWENFSHSRQKKRRFKVSYEDYQNQSEREFPQTFRWDFRKPKARVLLEFLSLSLNPSLAPEKFDTSPPGET